MEDELLIRQLRQGKPQALEIIYLKYKNLLLKIAFGLLNNVDSAEDAVQDVFVTLVRKPESYKHNSSLKSFLATCAANRAKTIIRAGCNNKTVNLDNSDMPKGLSDCPDKWLIINEEMKLLSQAMAEIPFLQREAVVLHIQADMTYKEISKLQKVSAKTVRSRCQYGLEKLRKLTESEVTS